MSETSQTKSMEYPNTSAHYAKKYGVTTRTIRRWMKLKYPLENPAAMAEEVALQKNVPRSFGNGRSPATRGLPPRAFTALVMGQWMHVRVNRWGRKLEKAMSEPGTEPEARKEAVSFVRAMIRRETRNGMMDMVKACAGHDLESILANRRVEDAIFNTPNEEEN